MNPPDYNPSGQPPQPAHPDPHESLQNKQYHEPYNPLAVMQPGERVICEVKRHPIGILITYALCAAMLIVFAVLSFTIVPALFGGSDSGSNTVGAIVFIIAAFLIIIFAFISNIVYWGNRWVVTSDSLTQISQTSLFSKQSAQLSLGNLEDVTTEKNGILTQLFNFGTLKAETAGERSKFVFRYCPSPNSYAQKILAAREEFELAHHGGKQEPFVQPPVQPPTQNLAQPPSQPAPYVPNPATPIPLPKTDQNLPPAYVPPPAQQPLPQQPPSGPTISQTPYPGPPQVHDPTQQVNPTDNLPPAY